MNAHRLSNRNLILAQAMVNMFLLGKSCVSVSQKDFKYMCSINNNDIIHIIILYMLRLPLFSVRNMCQ